MKKKRKEKPRRVVTDAAWGLAMLLDVIYKAPALADEAERLFDEIAERPHFTALPYAEQFTISQLLERAGIDT